MRMVVMEALTIVAHKRLYFFVLSHYYSALGGSEKKIAFVINSGLCLWCSRVEGKSDFHRTSGGTHQLEIPPPLGYFSTDLLEKINSEN